MKIIENEIYYLINKACIIYNEDRSNESNKIGVLVLFSIFGIWPIGDCPPPNLNESVGSIRLLSEAERFSYFINYVNILEKNPIKSIKLRKIFLENLVKYNYINDRFGFSVYADGELCYLKSRTSLVDTIFKIP